MNNPHSDTVDGLHIHIVSFGDDANSAAHQLAESHLMQEGGIKHGSTLFAQLTPEMTAQVIDSIIKNTHMVFILGSDNQENYQSPLRHLINTCQKNSILCYAILNLSDTSSTETDITKLCRKSNNVLLISTKEINANYSVCDLMQDAVLNITNPLLGKGLVAVDLDDIKTVMQCGSVVHVGAGSATGNQRAHQASVEALRLLPRVETACAIICNIEAGNDFDPEELNAISELIEKAVSDQCITINCSTLNTSTTSIKVRFTAIY